MNKISVIIPVYNVEKFLDKCVSSIINQPYKNLEIILVDDGSPDNCPAICDSWADKDDRIIVIHQPNGGVSSARNAGIDRATGDYISFIDSDDYINDNFSKVCEILNNINSKLVIIPLEPIDCDKEVVLNDQSFYHTIKDNSISISSPWSKFIKRELLLDNKFLEGVTVAEDKELVVRLLTKCEKFNIINLPFYTYYVNNESVTNSRGFKLTLKMFDSIQKIMDNINLYDVTETTKQNIKEVFSSHIYCIFRYYNYCSKVEKKQIKQLIRNNMHLFDSTQETGKKIVYRCMKIFGISFAIGILNLLRKLKILK